MEEGIYERLDVGATRRSALGGFAHFSRGHHFHGLGNFAGIPHALHPPQEDFLIGGHGA
jgi:hypothetical protein